MRRTSTISVPVSISKTIRQTAAARASARGRLTAAALGSLLVWVVPALSGCGAAGTVTASSNTALSITPGISSLDTNCTGCNASKRGDAVHQFSALLANGSAAPVSWSVAGGDRVGGAGTIDGEGRYTPPGYLTSDHADVIVTARLANDPAIAASARITVTPGFLQPLTPENAAVGANGTVTLTGKLAVAGGDASVRFALAATPSGRGTGPGTLGPTTCERSEKAFTTCTVIYTAPPAIASASPVYVVATARTAAGSNSRTAAEILLNSSGVNSNPIAHQELQSAIVVLGSSGGNNGDFDARGNTIADCCSGTLGALLEDNAGRQYVLSNNHVLAKSDHAKVGDSIVQPGLIDNNCTPNGVGPGTVPVASLSLWAPLKSPQTNVDAAIAQVGSRTIDPTGSIMELGARQADGTLTQAPVGISSTGGRGETAGLDMRVAKSGRTTGLTCGGISAVDLDVAVDYFSDCAETRPYLTKVFTNQVGISGDRFSDSGDSGALVVDASNAEPVGLFFAGGTDASGGGQGVANPATEVLNELGAAAENGTSFTFVGAADHTVSCLNYGDSTIRSAQERSLSDAEISRGEQALFAARNLVSPARGILGVSMGKSSDRAGEAAVLVYVNANPAETVPATIEGVRTAVVPATADEVALGTAPLENAPGAIALPGAALSRAVRVKQQVARGLMRRNSAFFGVGVGQSLDNPREAALVIYVDRNRMPVSLPQAIDGVRVRYVVMDRLHVTRSYAAGVRSAQHCLPSAAAVDEQMWSRPHTLNLR